MFEHFTSEAIRVIMLAQEEARRLGHNFVGTEQILLGLIGEGTGVAAKVLTDLGVTLKDARREVEKLLVGVLVSSHPKSLSPRKSRVYLSSLLEKLTVLVTTT
ncbi:Probable ATP-dependent Clp protease ATP-binding subunit [Raphidiopsis brookii D9]|nr:Probable ATP-dependent Clp protease ATP-binding subunit [Raphidiopsis brookii D9]